MRTAATRRTFRHIRCIATPLRHARACPGHPRLRRPTANKTWMVGASPATTLGLFRRVDARLRLDVDEAARLAPPKRRVVAAVAQQLRVRALLDDLAVVEDHQPV